MCKCDGLHNLENISLGYWKQIKPMTLKICLTFQIQQDGSWRIVSIAWQHEREDLLIPDRYTTDMNDNSSEGI